LSAAGIGIRVRLYTADELRRPSAVWNCRNSLAVMFELRCSEFGLFCSESAGQAQDKGAGGGRIREAAPGD